jgi:phosphoribosylanthranilate isomerase
MTRVKICGLTRPDDVAMACALGAAYVGFNFAESSPRRVSPEATRALADATAPGVRRVGVFRAEGPDAIARAVAAARLDLVQLHRPLAREDFDRFGVPVVGVLPVASDLLARCHAVLADASEGSGKRVDADALRSARFPVPLFVAGGLDAESVGAVIRALRPAAVDVASGGESAPGIKDRERLERLFAAVREADEEG